MKRRIEIAKFLCGFEAFHALFHAYLWLSGTPLAALGVTATPMSNAIGTLLNGVVAIALGVYAWRRMKAPVSSAD